MLELRNVGGKIARKLRLPPPAIPMMHAIIDGALLTRWVDRKLVQWPVDCVTTAGRKGGVT